MKFIDRFLNSITMYRLIGYGLGCMAVVAIVLGFTGVLSYPGFSLLGSAVILLVTCNLANFLLSKFFKVAANVESASITALILFFLLFPELNQEGLLTLVAAGVISMLSKYVLRIKKKHIFNPAAITAVILDLAGSGSVVWWVGSLFMLPFALILGLLVVRKIRRFRLFFAFLFAAVVAMIVFSLPRGENIPEVMMQAVTSWPIIFFGTIMLTEPLTTPPTKKLQVIYGLLVGALFGSQFQFGPIYSTPEMALVIGNIFSYIVSCKQKLTLSLVEKKELAASIYEFSFKPDEKLLYHPGQYLEWTLGHSKSDGRGVRRYFTISSSPTEDEIKLTIKAMENGSSFKKHLIEMKKGDQMYASSLGGEFTLPQNRDEKLVFIAGGIGLTPFRSMIKYLIDNKYKTDIVFFYACSVGNEFVYQDLFAQAEKELGIKVIYVVTNAKNVPPNWKGKTGYINEEMMKAEVPDYMERMFYLSGPDSMVQSYKKLLKGLNVKNGRIVTDYFPGF